MELVDEALGKADTTYEVLVAVDDRDPLAPTDQVRGYVCFGATPMTEATFDLYWIVVDAAARGRGVGSLLLGATETELRRRDVRTLRIETSSLEGQGGAAAFYRRNAYEQVGQIDDFYRAGDDLLTFAKRL
jgi:ribosomal protein S18 acetylase RimI-like enzyme